MNYIDNKVNDLIKKHKTMDPFEICHEKNIMCRLVDINANIKGVYQYVNRNKFIYINKNLSEQEQILTCYHELGHAVLHEKYNCTFLKTYTFFSVNKFEKEADYFASCFLIPDTSIVERLKGLTLEEISFELNVPREYVKLRFESIINSYRKELFTN